MRLLHRLRVDRRPLTVGALALGALSARALARVVGLMLLAHPPHCVRLLWRSRLLDRHVLLVRVTVNLLDDHRRLLARGGAPLDEAARGGLVLLALLARLPLLLLDLDLSAPAVLLGLGVMRLPMEHNIEILDRRARLVEAAVGDAAAQVGLGVRIIDLHRRRRVGERLPVLLEL